VKTRKKRKDLTLLWDADGTILYSQDWWENSFYLTVEHFGFAIPEDSETKRLFAGIQLREIYRKIVPEGFDIDECIKFHVGIQNRTMDLITLFDGEYDTLAVFQALGIKQGIVTARALRKPLVKSLETLGIYDFFQCIVCMEDVKSAKPDPEGIYLAMNKLDSDIGKTIMIGDTKYDISAGKNAGIRTIGVLYGSGMYDAEFLALNADFYVKSFEELKGVIILNL